MTTCRLPASYRYIATLSLIACLVSCLCSPSFAQGPALDARITMPDAPTPSADPLVSVAPAPSLATEHKFWDTPNIALFAAAAAFNGADFVVTHANLQGGGHELNPVVRIFGRSAPGLALNFGGETAGVMGFCYFLHKRGHHKLERAVSIVNIAASAGAVSYGLAHR